MKVRILLGAAATFALLCTGTPAHAQSPPAPMTSDQLLSGGCGVGIRAVRALREPGRYLVDMIVPVATAPLAAVLRVDDRNGHWLYPPTGAPQFAITVPESATGPINVFAAFARPATGQDVACRPSVYVPQRPVDDASAGQARAQLLPSSTVPDDPATCSVPFEKGGRILQPPNMRLPPEARGIEGIVSAALLVSADGSVASVRVLSSPSAVLGDALAQSMQRLEVKPPIFRCAPVESQIFMSMQIRRAPPG
ncbi:MAG: energy transducer TonB [Candidatus Eremiobacteraeota bacterium]|nr:energy transducer TonB [Candidatus Eremiobacteraeota bacterium]